MKALTENTKEELRQNGFGAINNKLMEIAIVRRSLQEADIADCEEIDRYIAVKTGEYNEKFKTMSNNGFRKFKKLVATMS